MMDAETFLTPDQCLEYGLIDKIDSYQADEKNTQENLMKRIQQLSNMIAQQKSFREQMAAFQQSAKSPPAETQAAGQEKKLASQLTNFFQKM